MAETEEELNNLLVRVKEESEKPVLKLNIKKMKIMASGPITSWQIEREKMETDRFSFLGLQKLLWKPWNTKTFAGRKAMKT